MSLRTRLTAFFVAIVVVPLLVAGAIVQAAIAREIEQRTQIRLAADAGALRAGWRGTVRETALRADLAAADLAQAVPPGRRLTGPGFATDVESARKAWSLDYVVVERDGRILASSLGPSRFLPGGPEVTAKTILAPGPAAPLLIPAQVRLTRPNREEVALVHAGLFLDQPEARDLSALAGNVRFEVAVGERVVAASHRPAARMPAEASGLVSFGGDLRGVFVTLGTTLPPAGATVAVVGSLEQDVSALRTAILLILFGTVLVTTLLGFSLARMIAGPLRRLADEASAMLAESAPAEPQPSADEVEIISTTFSVITSNLQEAERLSVTDALTGTGNRRFLEATLPREVERARRYHRGLSVLMVDIDHFKQVNDQHGHQAGDEVLVQLCRHIEGAIREGIDTLVRYGGEEFVVVVPETNHSSAMNLAERLRLLIRGDRFPTSVGARVSMTLSVGVASFPMDGDSADRLLEVADQALYRAKQLGRDRVASSQTAAPTG